MKHSFKRISNEEGLEKPVARPEAPLIKRRRKGKKIMTDEEENPIESFEAPEPKPFSGHNANRIVAILFVLGIHLLIFLKILVLE